MIDLKTSIPPTPIPKPVANQGGQDTPSYFPRLFVGTRNAKRLNFAQINYCKVSKIRKMTYVQNDCYFTLTSTKSLSSFLRKLERGCVHRDWPSIGEKAV